MTEKEVELNASFAVIHSKLRSLKKTLNSDQLKIYEDSMLAFKNEFIKNNSPISSDLLKRLDQMFI